jgi:putative ABC transport system permease protein
VPQGQLKDADAINTFYRQLLARMQSVPGVKAVAAATGVPPFGSGYTTPFQIVGKPNIEDPTARPSVALNTVSTEYYGVLGIHMVQGRDFNEQDRAAGVHVGVINETFAKKYFSGVDPIGQRILFSPLAPGIPKLAPPVEWQIVGVYRDVRNRGQRAEIFPEIDVPFEQNPWPTCMIAVRSGVEPETLTKSMATAVQSLDPNLPLAHPISMDSLLVELRAGERFEAILFGGFAVIALVLAALGIYGVMSFAVAQRTHEIGLRMALGAGQDSVMVLVIREGILLVLVGLALGFCGAILVGRSMRGMWYEVGTVDPSAFSAVAAMLVASALLACYLPARRATQIDPIEALREE